MAFQVMQEHLIVFCYLKNRLVPISTYAALKTFFFHMTFPEICIMLQEFIIVSFPIQTNRTELSHHLFSFISSFISV